MALTEIPSELSSTPSIVDGGNATAITIDASENATFAGSVGIGGTSLSTKLEVADSNAGAATIRIRRTDVSNSDVDLTAGGGSDGKAFDISVNQANRMRIDSSGSLRINNTRTTATKLHVVGGTASGTMYDTAVFAGGQNSTSGSGARIYLSGCENDPISRGTSIAGQMTDNGNSHALIFSTSGNSQAPAERMRIGSDGTTGFFGAGANTRSDITMTVTTSDSSKRWGFGGGATGNSAVFYVINESNVGVYMGHGGQSWIAHSDERIKENITDVGTVLPSLMNMRCVKYNLISNPSDTKIGFIAQDWQSAFPEVVDENEHLVLEDDGTVGTDDDSDSTTPVKAMAYTETIPLLLKAIQEQQATIETLTQRIETLENN
jgi:hypothetical protein